MKLSQYREDYYTHTGNASSVCRQAAFAGIALIWVFNNKTGNQINLPNGLLWPSLFMITGLSLDLLQYVAASAIWGTFHRVNEKKFSASSDPDITAPAWLNWPALTCFWGKLIAVISGYVSLFSYVVHSISFGYGIQPPASTGG